MLTYIKRHIVFHFHLCSKQSHSQMERKTFLRITSFIAIAVGLFALVSPSLLHDSKGTIHNEATHVWTAEVGILLIAIGMITYLARKEKDTQLLKALFIGNTIIQCGLFIIELLAYLNGIITKSAGVIPNLILHIILASGFVYYLINMKIKPKAQPQKMPRLQDTITVRTKVY